MVISRRDVGGRKNASVVRERNPPVRKPPPSTTDVLSRFPPRRLTPFGISD